jgi:hypothetical protein
MFYFKTDLNADYKVFAVHQHPTDDHLQRILSSRKFRKNTGLHKDEPNIVRGDTFHDISNKETQINYSDNIESGKNIDIEDNIDSGENIDSEYNIDSKDQQLQIKKLL